MLNVRAVRWEPKLPNSIIKHDKKKNETRRNANQEGKGQWEGETGRSRERIRREQRKKIPCSAVLLKERFPCFVDDGTRRIQMHNRIIACVAIETLINKRQRKLVLMSHTSRGSNSVVYERKVKKKEIRVEPYI